MIQFAIGGVMLGISALAGAFVATKKARESHEMALRSKPFPKEWEKYVQENVKLYQFLPPHLQKELKGYINLFVAEKHFEGAGGLEVTDEMRVTVAGLACLLLLNRKTRNYPKLTTVVMYPTAFFNGPNTDEVRLGESWQDGAVVLAWDHVTSSSYEVDSGRNLVIHEFAHRLDQVDGAGDGVPDLQTESQYSAWAHVMSEEFERLQKRVDKGYKTLIRPYGATNSAEFFSCITETFFEKPVALKRKHPEIYEQLKGFYNLDPVTWHEEEAPTYLDSPFKTKNKKKKKK